MLSDGILVMLVVVSFFTSFTTAAIGIGGGATLLAIMAQVVPVSAIIPVHGVIQLGSNVGRAAVLFRSIDWRLLRWFAAGCALGALIGGRLVVNLPVDVLKLVFGVFILYSAWGPRLRWLSGSARNLAVGGVLTSTLTMFVGATGPFVVSILRAFSLDKVALVATSAGALSIQHLLKVVAFGVLGFAFAPWIPLMVLMIASGFLGTLAGRHVLLRVDPVLFGRILNAVLTLLALKLILDVVLSRASA